MTKIHTREYPLSVRRFDTEARTADVVISSEFPVPIGGDVRQVLKHTDEAIDRSRGTFHLNIGHQTSRPAIGRVTDFRIEQDPDTGLREQWAVARFGYGLEAEETWQDVQAGIGPPVSVSFEILSAEQRGGIEYVNRWRLIEISIVGTGADPRAQFRNMEKEMSEVQTRELSRRERAAQRDADEQAREARAVVEREEQNTEIRRLADKFGKRYRQLPQVADDIIAAGGSVDDMNAAVRHAITTAKPEPVPTGHRALAYELATRDAQIEGGAPAWLRATRNNPVRRHFGEDDRLAERNHHASNMWLYARAGHGEAQRWVRDNGAAYSRALGEGIFTAGGAAVPEELAGALISLREEYGIARQFARIWPMGSDSTYVPRRTAGTTAYFTTENAAFTESDMTLDQVGLHCQTESALTRISRQLIDDAAVDIASVVVDEHAYSFAEQEDGCLFDGDGTSSYGGMVGIKTKLDSGKAGAVSVSTVDKFSEVTTAHLAQVMGSLPLYAHRGAAWYCSQACFANVFMRLAAATGGASMLELGGVQLGQYGGYPIRISQKLATSTDSLDGEIMMLFGNMMLSTAFGDRQDLQMEVLRERYAEYHQLGFKSVCRFDVVTHDVGDNTSAGPLVALYGSAS